MSDRNITLFINSLGGGGAEGVCINLANSLAARGWKVTLLVLHLNQAVRHEQLSENVELRVLGKNHTRNAVTALLSFLLQNKPKKILVFNHQLAVLLVILRAIARLDLIIVARNINTLTQKRLVEKSFWHKHIVHGFTKVFFKKVNQIIAQSYGMAEDLVAVYGIKRKKIITIHNPVNSTIEHHGAVETTTRKDYLLCVGRLEPQKSLHTAITAFAAIASDYPHLQLKIVGKGSMESSLKQLAEALNVHERVSFEGYQTDMIPYYVNAKATLLTSLYEGFPNVLVESISLGTPVLAFDCPSGPSEIVIDGENGFLVRYKDDAQLKVCLTQVLEIEWMPLTVASTARKFRGKEIIDAYENVLLETNN